MKGRGMLPVAVVVFCSLIFFAACGGGDDKNDSGDNDSITDGDIDAAGDGDDTTHGDIDTAGDGDLSDGDTAENNGDGDTETSELNDSDAADGDTTDGDIEVEPEVETENEAESETESEDESDGEEAGLCSGACTPGGADASFCPDGLFADALCRCYPEDSQWKPVSCAEYCEGQDYEGSDGCALSTGEYLYDCLCRSDCSDSEAVSTMCGSGGIPEYNNCTCAAADPCAWADNDFCDASFCYLLFPDDHFDDSADCDADCSDSGVVEAMCEGSTLNNCTCAAADPCGWANDSICNSECEWLYPDAHFDDGADCGQAK